MLLDPVVELSQLLDQLLAGQDRFLQFQHHAVNEVLVQRRRDALGQREDLHISRAAPVDPHKQPIRTAFDVQIPLRRDRAACGGRVIARPLSTAC